MHEETSMVVSDLDICLMNVVTWDRFDCQYEPWSLVSGPSSVKPSPSDGNHGR